MTGYCSRRCSGNFQVAIARAKEDGNEIDTEDESEEDDVDEMASAALYVGSISPARPLMTIFGAVKPKEAVRHNAVAFLLNTKIWMSVMLGIIFVESI
jgi:hypothetical protein